MTTGEFYRKKMTRIFSDKIQYKYNNLFMLIQIDMF